MHCESPQDVLTAIRTDWPPADWCNLHVAIAVSGGSDSTALLRAVMELKTQHQGAGRVTAMHVNHRLRAAASDADEVWLVEQCKLLGVPLTILHGNAEACSQASGDSIEAAARQERYQLLAEAAERLGVRYLATGHTSSDQAETVLFRLLRGSGLRGLSGIPRTRPLTPAVTLVRPLLGCSREMLTSYLRGLGQAYRTDHTNSDLQMTRNRIRHELLPKLREDYNADVDAALLRLAAQANDARQFLEMQAAELLESSATELARQEYGGQHQLSLDLQPFSQQPTILVAEALRMAWREANLPEQAMTYAWWRKLANLAQSPLNKKVLNLPGNVLATIAGKQLHLRW